jgi:hypothetical protein
MTTACCAHTSVDNPHYGKIRRCRATYQCREPPHGKEIIAVRSKQHARQRLSARQNLRAAHGNEGKHGKDRSGARQRISSRQSTKKAHGKERKTAKSLHAARQRNNARQRPWALPWLAPLPCGQVSCTAKAPLPCVPFFAVRQYNFFCFSFYFISSNTYIYLLISFSF